MAKKATSTEKLNPVTTEGAKVPVTRAEVEAEKEREDREQLLKDREEANQKGLPDPEDKTAPIVRPAQESAAPVTQPSQIDDGIKYVTGEPVVRSVSDPHYVAEPVITERTKAEMEKGRKAVATAAKNLEEAARNSDG